MSTLKFAHRAKSVRNTAHVNEDADQRTLLRKYEAELRKLRAELQMRQREVVDKRHLLAVSALAMICQQCKGLCCYTSLQLVLHISGRFHFRWRLTVTNAAEHRRPGLAVNNNIVKDSICYLETEG